MSSTWQQQLKQALNNQKHPDFLHQHPQHSTAAAALFSHVIAPDMFDAIDQKNPQDPILKQFLPVADETINTPGFHADPVDDNQATQVAGLIHKYHGRVLLIASGSCAVNCRYCFRRHFPYTKSYAPRNNWRASIEYIKAHKDIHEVILSGGDPLTLETTKLQQLTAALAPVEHVKTLRIHSRIPVVLSQRIDQEFLHWSRQLKLNKVMVLHVNHANELTNKAQAAITKLKQAGYTLLNQSVILKGVNDTATVLAQLSQQLFESGVLPYYLHQFDQVQNAAHFMVDEATSQKIHQDLQSLLPGYLVPKLVKEVAGEKNKTQISL
ncbi:EF-P beta-lysylation protein EpmB [Marinicella sp. S1101]|uniref:EF-P beta-lysylation protein EpmB n=1 Tax=Marinicella marina TaxID=2996016 RepID=UPI002260ABC0|nr:EF-P beta-lysylation protein EpmB [Marinicella marina]MCX7554777.1 EF-P beta-lysylation protein EpmB [Marinicella marina]MDJ1140990.1 EF-P beta-lysylation protein EpmB [Marinicella marina]